MQLAPNRLRGVERLCVLVGVVLIASGVLHLGIAAVSDRAWDGPLSWRKPATFGLSFGITLLATTWVAGLLSMSGRVRGSLLGVLAADCVLEVGGITVQAWRDVPSHFNTATAADAAIAYSLAVGGAVLMAVFGTLAWLAFAGHTTATASMRLALRAGFALLLAGLLAGVAMIVRGTVLIRTGHRTAGYDQAGFLKAFHGITLHAVLVLPALAWWLAHRHVGDERRRTQLVAAATAGYVIAAGAVLVWSLMRL